MIFMVMALIILATVIVWVFDVHSVIQLKARTQNAGDAAALAAFGLGSHESAPDPSRLYGGFWDGVPVVDGQLHVPTFPGVGFEHKANLMAVLHPLR